VSRSNDRFEKRGTKKRGTKPPQRGGEKITTTTTTEGGRRVESGPESGDVGTRRPHRDCPVGRHRTGGKGNERKGKGKRHHHPRKEEIRKKPSRGSPGEEQECRGFWGTGALSVRLRAGWRRWGLLEEEETGLNAKGSQGNKSQEDPQAGERGGSTHAFFGIKEGRRKRRGCFSRGREEQKTPIRIRREGYVDYRHHWFCRVLNRPSVRFVVVMISNTSR